MILRLILKEKIIGVQTQENYNTKINIIESLFWMEQNLYKNLCLTMLRVSLFF
jgi:hypothetical protein